MNDKNKVYLCLSLLLSGCDAFLLEPCPGPSWSEVSTGYVHICALANNGEVACTSTRDIGEVPLGPLRGVTSGYDFSCALDEDNTPICWASEGSMGGDVADTSQPYLRLEAGMDHVCGIHKVDNTVGCWGEDDDGQAAVPPDNQGAVTALSVGNRHTCAIDAAGALRCWGAPGAWLAEGVGGAWVLVAAGKDLTCAVDLDGVLTCWGRLPRPRRWTGSTLSPGGGSLGLCAADADELLAARSWRPSCRRGPRAPSICP
ncbi:MAG: hypothetical protein IPO67_16210 [Deltaproteobacteria bacterium]|nr:hypothetical protein [Deltaproteobacteria bacterium]